MEYIDFPLQDGSTYEVSFVEGKFYEDHFPTLNVPEEFCAMASWLYSNPKKRKTRRGTRTFINGWLNRARLQQQTGWRVRMEARVGAHR